MAGSGTHCRRWSVIALPPFDRVGNTDCKTKPYSPGRPRCRECHQSRLTNWGVVAVIVFRFCDGAYRVRFSYEPDLVELLKDTGPEWARSWDPTTKGVDRNRRVRPHPGVGDPALRAHDQ